MRAEQLRASLDLLVLASLDGGPLHGYALVERLRERSAGEVDLAAGTIYPALHRLERARLVRSRWESPGNQRRRRVYTLTRSGQTRLRRELESWETMQRVVRAVVAEGGT